MKVKDGRMGYSYMDVFFDDGRAVRFNGECILLDSGKAAFVAYENSLKNWKEPDGEPISAENKKEILDAVKESAKTWKSKIIFE